MLSSPFRIVLEQTVTAIATVADSSEKLFANYYPHFMPHLKNILVTANTPAYRMLRGKTMECISLIGIAVGKEVFASDAADVMAMLQAAQQVEMDPDDPQISYMLAAWARMCEILGDDFIPYLGIVMPPLLRSVKLEAKLMFLEETDDVNDLDGGAENWEVVGVADKRIGIKTSVLEEKKTACEMLNIYVTQLKAGFAEYVEPVTAIMLELLEFAFDETVRSRAASTLPALLTAALEHEQLKPHVPQMWAMFHPALLKAAAQESELEVLSWQVEALKDCIDIVGRDQLTEAFLIELAKGIVEWLEECEARYQERLQERDEEDFDQDAAVKLQEDEQHDVQIIQEVAHLMHSLFNALTVEFLPIFDQMLQYFLRMLSPDRPPTDRQWSLCVFDDLVEACGPESVRYAEHFVPFMLQYIKDTHPYVRQAAAYGMGVMASVEGGAYVETCKLALPHLMEVVQSEDARTYGNREATENAISAILKIVKNEAHGFPLATSLPSILQWLPITEDAEEADYIYSYLCDLIAEGNPAMVATPDNLVRFVEVVTTSIATPVMPIDSETGQKIALTLNGMRGQSPEQMQAIMGQLQPETQTKLTALFSASTA